MQPKFNGVALTEESMQATRQWFHDNHMACVKAAQTGAITPNDVDLYIERHTSYAQQSLEGFGDHSVAFLQRAYYIQTGESVALLP